MAYMKPFSTIAFGGGSGARPKNTVNYKPLKTKEKEEEEKVKQPKFVQPTLAPIAPTAPAGGGGMPAPTVPAGYTPLTAPVYSPTMQMPVFNPAQVDIAQRDYALPNVPGMAVLQEQAARNYSVPEAMRWNNLPDIEKFAQSQQTQDMYARYLEQLNNQPGAYTSQYQPEMDALYRQMDRGPFKYDLNADMLYQQAKDQYVQNAQRSMMDAQGQAAALTGGYGSSYGQQLGQQQYDQHLTQLNNNLPAFYDRAYNEWLNEGNQLANRFNMAAQLEGLDYGKYRDAMGDWQNMLGHTAQMFDAGRAFDLNVKAQDDANAFNLAGMDQQAARDYQDALFQRAAMQMDDYYKGEQLGLDRAQIQEQFADNNYARMMQDAAMREQMRQSDVDTQFRQAGLGLDNYQAQMDAWLRGENLNLDRARFEAERFDKQQAQAREIALAAFASGKTPPTEILEQSGYSPGVAQLLADIYKPKPGGSGSANKIKLDFTMDEIALATEAYEQGGEAGLDRFITELILSGKSPEAGVMLRTHIGQNYEYTPPANQEPIKGAFEPYTPVPVSQLSNYTLPEDKRPVKKK